MQHKLNSLEKKKKTLSERGAILRVLLKLRLYYIPLERLCEAADVCADVVDVVPEADDVGLQRAPVQPQQVQLRTGQDQTVPAVKSEVKCQTSRCAKKAHGTKSSCFYPLLLLPIGSPKIDISSTCTDSN